MKELALVVGYICFFYVCLAPYKTPPSVPVMIFLFCFFHLVNKSANFLTSHIRTGRCLSLISLILFLFYEQLKFLFSFHTCVWQILGRGLPIASFSTKIKVSNTLS